MPREKIAQPPEKTWAETFLTSGDPSGREVEVVDDLETRPSNVPKDAEFISQGQYGIWYKPNEFSQAVSVRGAREARQLKGPLATARETAAVADEPSALSADELRSVAVEGLLTDLPDTATEAALGLIDPNKQMISQANRDASKEAMRFMFAQALIAPMTGGTNLPAGIGQKAVWTGLKGLLFQGAAAGGISRVMSAFGLPGLASGPEAAADASANIGGEAGAIGALALTEKVINPRYRPMLGIIGATGKVPTVRARALGQVTGSLAGYSLGGELNAAVVLGALGPGIYNLNRMRIDSKNARNLGFFGPGEGDSASAAAVGINQRLSQLSDADLRYTLEDMLETGVINSLDDFNLDSISRASKYAYVNNLSAQRRANRYYNPVTFEHEASEIGESQMRLLRAEITRQPKFGQFAVTDGLVNAVRQTTVPVSRRVQRPRNLDELQRLLKEAKAKEAALMAQAQPKGALTQEPQGPFAQATHERLQGQRGELDKLKQELAELEGAPEPTRAKTVEPEPTPATPEPEPTRVEPTPEPAAKAPLAQPVTEPNPFATQLQTEIDEATQEIDRIKGALAPSKSKNITFEADAGFDGKAFNIYADGEYIGVMKKDPAGDQWYTYGDESDLLSDSDLGSTLREAKKEIKNMTGAGAQGPSGADAAKLKSRLARLEKANVRREGMLAKQPKAPKAATKAVEPKPSDTKLERIDRVLENDLLPKRSSGYRALMAEKAELERKPVKARTFSAAITRKRSRRINELKADIAIRETRLTRESDVLSAAQGRPAGQLSPDVELSTATHERERLERSLALGPIATITEESVPAGTGNKFADDLGQALELALGDRAAETDIINQAVVQASKDPKKLTQFAGLVSALDTQGSPEAAAKLRDAFLLEGIWGSAFSQTNLEATSQGFGSRSFSGERMLGWLDQSTNKTQLEKIYGNEGYSGIRSIAKLMAFHQDKTYDVVGLERGLDQIFSFFKNRMAFGVFSGAYFGTTWGTPEAALFGAGGGLAAHYAASEAIMFSASKLAKWSMKNPKAGRKLVEASISGDRVAQGKWLRQLVREEEDPEVRKELGVGSKEARERPGTNPKRLLPYERLSEPSRLKGL